jgi:hypothetical protein
LIIVLYTGIFDITVIFIEIKMKVVIGETFFFITTKPWICSRLIAGIAGLNPTGAWMPFLLSVVWY